MSDQIQASYRIDRELILINPPGVDLKKFSPTPPNPELVRELNLNPSIPVVLSLGRLSPEKNLPFLFDALAPLLKAGKITLLLVGDGPMKKKLEEDIHRSGLEASVRLAGLALRPEAYYSLARIFVSVSRYESFGQTILEAMASELPVVALRDDRPGIMVASAEIVGAGKTGYLIPDNPAVLREKIELLLEDEELRREFGLRGREVCRERFSWDRHVDGLQTALNNL
jgi:1,2-diacylglycerol 3-alpha-glucosyltransferase